MNFEFTTEVVRIAIDMVDVHPLHSKHNVSRSSEQMEYSMKKMRNKPINKIIVVINPNKKGHYLVISGMIRLEGLVALNVIETEMLVITGLKNDTEIEEFVIESNKQKKLSSYEELAKLRFFKIKYGNKSRKGDKKIPSIAKEMGWTENEVREFDLLDNFYKGDGDIILISILDNILSRNQASQLKKIILRYPERFNSELSYQRMCNGKFDFGKLPDIIEDLSIDDDIEFSFMGSYISGDIDDQEINKRINQLGKVRKNLREHAEYKNSNVIANLNPEYNSEHSYIIKGDNRFVEFKNPFNKKVGVIIGSPPYGIGEKRPDMLGMVVHERLDGKQTAIRLAETYERYLIYLEDDGSIYVIIDDFRLESGEFACSVEHFVIEMEKRGMYLVGRYIWRKTNPISKSHNTNGMVSGFEMVYRFSKMKKGFKNVGRMLIENEIDGLIYKAGATNPMKNGDTQRGAGYIQSNLKKVRNTLNEQTGHDYIEGNVANPEDFFRITEGENKEIRHTSTTPIWLTTMLIAEASEKGDVILDIWNGVGNTMTSALITQRLYVGIEREDIFIQQTCRRVKETEAWVSEAYGIDTTPLLLEYKLAS